MSVRNWWLATLVAFALIAGGFTLTLGKSGDELPEGLVEHRLYHEPVKPGMRWEEAGGALYLRLASGSEVSRAWLLVGEAREAMRLAVETGEYRHWEARRVGAPGGAPLAYGFEVRVDPDPTPVFVGPQGLSRARAKAGEFGYTPSESPLVRVPGWVARAVFYQIFPERFANGDPTNDPPETGEWTARPTPSSFSGGDLQGVLDRLGYLEELGVNAIWFTPIFDSISNHKYDTREYLKIDPNFGTLETFDDLVDALRTRGIRLILDGVFNHTGDEFWAFEDVERKGPGSPYYDWYEIWNWPLTRNPPSYRTWSGTPHMPELNVDNPAVRAHLFEVVRYWMRRGIDGWRLDVPNELPHEFWREFRGVVKAENPEAYIVGEIWREGGPWLRGDQFDAVMNYRFRDALAAFIGQGREGPGDFDERLAAIRLDYPAPVFGVLLNLIGSHDTERFLTLARGDARRLKLAALVQMTYPGAPIVYYGDEVGVAGGRDPDNRRTFPVERSEWNADLLGWYRGLIALRRSEAVLQTGDVKTVLVDDQSRLYAFARFPVGSGVEDPAAALVALNAGQASRQVRLPAAPGTRWLDPLAAVEYLAGGEGLAIELAPLSGMVLLRRR